MNTKIFLVLLLVFAVYIPVNGQIKFSAGPTLGITMPQSDYSGTSTDYYSGLKYGLGTGFNFGGVLKVKLPVFVNVRAAVNYSVLNNSGVSSTSNPQSQIDNTQKILLISVGPEFSFSLPGSPIKPYAGVDFLFTGFTGETVFQGVSGVPSGTYGLSTATRTGIGLGVGAEMKIGSSNALDISFRYNLHNLFSKSYEGPYDSNRRLDSYIFLNDAKDPRYPDDINNHPVGSDRNITTMQINIAFLFGLQF